MALPDGVPRLGWLGCTRLPAGRRRRETGAPCGVQVMGAPPLTGVAKPRPAARCQVGQARPSAPLAPSSPACLPACLLACLHACLGLLTDRSHVRDLGRDWGSAPPRAPGTPRRSLNFVGARGGTSPPRSPGPAPVYFPKVVCTRCGPRRGGRARWAGGREGGQREARPPPKPQGRPPFPHPTPPHPQGLAGHASIWPLGKKLRPTSPNPPPYLGPKVVHSLSR